MLRPDQRAQPENLIRVTNFNRGEIYAGSRGYTGKIRGNLRRLISPDLAFQQDRGICRPDIRPLSIAIAVAVPEQVQAGARSDLHQKERPAAGPPRHLPESGQQAHAPADLV